MEREENTYRPPNHLIAFCLLVATLLNPLNLRQKSLCSFSVKTLSKKRNRISCVQTRTAPGSLDGPMSALGRFDAASVFVGVLDAVGIYFDRRE